MKQIFVTRQIPQEGIDLLKEKGYSVDIYPKDEIIGQKQLVKCLKKKPYDVVICLLTDNINAAVFDAAPSVKLYANYAVGFDNVDVVEAAKRGIVVTNTPGDYVECVAEHAIAMMLALAIRLVEADEYVRAGKYKGWSPMGFLGSDIADKTFGTIGAGHIGERAAIIAHQAFRMKIVYSDVVRNTKLEQEFGAEYKASPEEVLQVSDVVTLNTPLLPMTKHLIDARRLAMMKPTSFLINTSRGPVVDEVALVEALKAGTIAGAGLDVFEFEPKLSKGLAKLPNVILTPHTASARQNARIQMSEIAAKNVIEYLEGRTPPNLVK